MEHLTTCQRVPATTFKTRTDTGWLEISSAEIFDGKTVVVFSLPGAFTPSCSASQLPGYNRLAPVFKANGVDEIVCVSVIDAFVMHAWQRGQNANIIIMIPDGNGEFTAGMGMLVDKQDLGFGHRSWRYSMLVREGVIEQIFVEPDEPGDPYGVSDPETMLAYINPHARVPDAIAILTRAGCPHCVRATALLDARGMPFDELEIDGVNELFALSGAKTTPQIFINGECIGGADELAAHLAETLAA
jgi:peroxiredoxin/glutaredoxin